MSYRRIVIGVDFATASLAAVQWVASAFGRRARMLLVHVTPDPHRPRFLKEHLPATDALQAAPAVYHGLRRLADLAGRDRSDVDILAGCPADGLALAAREFGADLICVGKSRQRRGSGRFGATTPQRVSSRTSLPVLVVPENARAQPDSVLAAVNDGWDGMHVLQSATRLALAWDARLDALHVLEPELHAVAQEAVRGTITDTERTVGHFGAPLIAGGASDAELCVLAREWLADQVAGLKMRKERVTPIARLGDAGEEIIGHAARSHTSLIVLGRCSREASTPGTAPLGSTARLTMWVAPCPVLVLGAHSPSPRHHASGGGRHNVIPRWDAPELTVLTGAATPHLRSSPRPDPDGGDAA